LLDAFDRQRQVDLAARLVARHLQIGHSPQALITTLARAVLREDAGFHAYQMLEAGVRHFAEWDNTKAGRHILIAVARYLDRTRGAEDSRNRPSLDARRRASSGRGCILVMRPNCYLCLPCVASRSLTYGLMHTRGYAASETRASLSCEVVMGHPHPLFYTCVIPDL
jgi:hypothetical protein